jgi:spore coat protein U-like protein
MNAKTTRKFFRIGGLIGACAVIVQPNAASAATASADVAVSATVQATCGITTTSLAFGTYTGTQTDASSTISVTCTNTTPYNIGLSAGLASGATVTTRKMVGPSSASLSYSLFQDAPRSVNWGTAIPGETLGGIGNGSAQTITIYGRIDASQFVVPGAYTDTVTAVVNY